MAVHLVRHADALPRSGWGEPDELRPLSPRGKTEAGAIVAQFAARPVGRILSSPAIRCMSTVEPLARARALEVEPEMMLFEGSDPARLLDSWFDEPSHEGTVLCSHGDLIPELLRLLAGRGVDLGGAGWGRCAKGSTWSVDGDRAVYTPPPRKLAAAKRRAS